MDKVKQIRFGAGLERKQKGNRKERKERKEGKEAEGRTKKMEK